MNVEWFLLDNNVLGKLSRAQRAGKFVRTQCRIPADVLYEASGLADINQLRSLDYPVSARVLKQVQRVMATVRARDSSLVDMYRCKGTADPLIIATALDALEMSSSTLFPEVWTIVTDDKAIRAKAAEFEIPSLSSAELLTKGWL